MQHILQDFFLTKQEPVKSCLLSVRSIILAMDSAISETIKYGMPCFCYMKKILCYLWTDKKTAEPYILMAAGRLLKHPELISGDRARMKIFPLHSAKDLPVTTIRSIVKEGLAVISGDY